MIDGGCQVDGFLTACWLMSCAKELHTNEQRNTELTVQFMMSEIVRDSLPVSISKAANFQDQIMC
jgi:hypothetical protein